MVSSPRVKHFTSAEPGRASQDSKKEDQPAAPENAAPTRHSRSDYWERASACSAAPPGLQVPHIPTKQVLLSTEPTQTMTLQCQLPPFIPAISHSETHESSSEEDMYRDKDDRPYCHSCWTPIVTQPMDWCTTGHAPVHSWCISNSPDGKHQCWTCAHAQECGEQPRLMDASGGHATTNEERAFAPRGEEDQRDLPSQAAAHYSFNSAIAAGACAGSHETSSISEEREDSI